MVQRKATPNWMPAPRHLDLYADIDLTGPKRYSIVNNTPPGDFKSWKLIDTCTFNLTFLLIFHPLLMVNPSRDVDKSAWANMKRMVQQLKVWRDIRAQDAEFHAANLSGDELVDGNMTIRQELSSLYSRVDESVGTLMSTLEELGLREYCGHLFFGSGFYVGDHGWYDKRWMYEESLKMPLIVKWPRYLEILLTSILFRTLIMLRRSLRWRVRINLRICRVCR